MIEADRATHRLEISIPGNSLIQEKALDPS